jgi:hypothetical protein
MTVEIPLTQGKVALIDDEDLALVSKYKWHAQKIVKKNVVRWYAYSGIRLSSGKQTQLQMHRLIMAAKAGQIVDHRNRDGLDCRRNNLRFCSTSQNNINRAKIGGTSKYKGVSKTPSGKWQTMFLKKYVGLFSDEIEAAKAYDAIAKQQFGEYAYLNFG